MYTYTYIHKSKTHTFIYTYTFAQTHVIYLHLPLSLSLSLTYLTPLGIQIFYYVKTPPNNNLHIPSTYPPSFSPSGTPPPLGITYLPHIQPNTPKNTQTSSGHHLALTSQQRNLLDGRWLLSLFLFLFVEREEKNKKEERKENGNKKTYLKTLIMIQSNKCTTAVYRPQPFSFYYAHHQIGGRENKAPLFVIPAERSRNYATF